MSLEVEPSAIARDHSPEVQLRVWRDILSRARPGIVIYPVFWLVVALGSDFDQSHRLLTWSAALFFVLVSLGRWLHMAHAEQWYVTHRRLWIGGAYLGATLHGLGWGMLFAYSLLIDEPNFGFVMGISSAGIVAGGTNGFSPSRSLSLFYATLFLAPSIFVTLLVLANWVELSLIVAYLGYMIILSQQQNREYWRSLNNEFLLEVQSRTDALTTLKNRRYFDEKLAELCHLGTRDHVYIALMVFDVDYFKKINDSYGHDFGDECLRQIAKVIDHSLPRATDVCARYGGEEFSVILAGTELAGALLVAERIRTAVATHRFMHGAHAANLTVSIGVVAAHLERYQKNMPDLLFKKADEALYRAKNSGRNCVVSAGDFNMTIDSAQAGKS